MKRALIVILVVVLLAGLFFTRPDDKTCKEVAVKAVWGELMPGKQNSPRFYEQFMDLNSSNVVISDWIFFKYIQYKIGKETRNVGIGAFNKVYVLGK